ncbi:MAG: glycosyltransferase family 4 protein [Candidatus Ancaeobacter aquaticus]|nr:glycosyltransferase family 4 protein [Candidatus Ancaeobacter aquaticus]
MKIALIREKVSPFGGAEKNVWCLAKGLCDKGHDVHIYAHSWDNELSGVMYHRVQFLKTFSFIKPLLFSTACRNMLASEVYDVVQSFDRTLCQDVYRAGDGCHRQWLRQLSKERGLTAHFLKIVDPKHMLLLHIEKKLYQDPKLKKIIANSMMVKNEIVHHYGVSEELIKVIYNGVEECPGPLTSQEKSVLRKEMHLADNDYVILFAGSNYERKGLRYLIESVVDIKAAKVLVVGKGNEKMYRAFAKKCNVSDRILFCGVQQDIKKFYRVSDIFVLPTLYDPFSNVTLEAMSYGLPVITSPHNGAGEIIANGVQGYVEDPAHMTKRIMALEDKNLQRTMGENALDKAKQYSFKKVLDETEEVYKEIVNI